MKLMIKVVSTISLVLVTILVSCALTFKLADKYWNQAQRLEKQGRYLEAAQMFEKSAQAESESPEPRLEDLGIELSQAGFCYYQIGQYEKAIKNFKEALTIARKLKQEDKIAIRLNNIGMVYNAWGQYDKAIQNYEEALTIGRKLKQEDEISIRLNNIGTVYYSWGKYDKAIRNFEEALAIDRKLKQEDKISIRLNNIGVVYEAWGQYDKAIKNYEQTLAIVRKLKQEDKIAGILNNIGMIYGNWGQYDKAIKYYEQALAIDKKLGKEADIAISLSNIGIVYEKCGQYYNAIKYYEQALSISKKLGKESAIAIVLNNIGTVYYELKNYSKAITNFEESVEITEKLRKTATGDVRRDYIASQLHTYQYLTSTYIRSKDFHNAFRTIELSRAKLLAEQLAGSETEVTIPSVEKIQKEMPDERAILVYADVGLAIPVSYLVITNSNIYGLEISDNAFVASALARYETSVQTMLKNQRGIKIIAKKEKKEELAGSFAKKDDFENIINYYRNLLTNPTIENNKKAGELSRMLYDFLIEPIASHINDKNELIIIPDGVLGFLPFETLIDENGQYLVETYHITYTQSMGVLELIKSRKYKESRKPLLAFGGAVYDEVTYAVDMVENERELAYLEKNVYSAFASRGSVRNAYGSLGFGDWENLPGTLSEVKEIKNVVKGTEIITGKEVTENKVKVLSTGRKLAGYKVLHFATHGLVVPAVPELSAVVLSQFKIEQENEDGYLRMGEIAELDIQADFVNLSACETGLGKVYGGEGVVGLTQSFLIAGANAMSVSLWQVADVSTSQFMVSMYELVKEQDIGYADSMTKIKRKFINGEFGESYKTPYYWAPFVYYGK